MIFEKFTGKSNFEKSNEHEILSFKIIIWVIEFRKIEPKHQILKYENSESEILKQKSKNWFPEKCNGKTRIL